jgi:hypothetical protein
MTPLINHYCRLPGAGVLEKRPQSKFYNGSAAIRVGADRTGSDRLLSDPLPLLRLEERTAVLRKNA